MPRQWFVSCALGLVLVTSWSVAAHASEPKPDLHARLIAYYARAANYRKVKRDVLRWHKTTRNGCVAFASTALRHVGFEIPERGKRAGYGVSRITFAFSAYLEQAGWHRVTNVQELRAGDIIFTTGYPDHVFVFHSWARRSRRVARVIDNKGFMIRRAMLPKRDSRTAAFSYALRVRATPHASGPITP